MRTPACSFRKRAPPPITTMLVSCFFGCWRILRNKGVGLGLPVSVSLFKQNAQRVPGSSPVPRVEMQKQLCLIQTNCAEIPEAMATSAVLTEPVIGLVAQATGSTKTAAQAKLNGLREPLQREPRPYQPGLQAKSARPGEQAAQFRSMPESMLPSCDGSAAVHRKGCSKQSTRHEPATSGRHRVTSEVNARTPLPRHQIAQRLNDACCIGPGRCAWVV